MPSLSMSEEIPTYVRPDMRIGHAVHLFSAVVQPNGHCSPAFVTEVFDPRPGDDGPRVNLVQVGSTAVQRTVRHAASPEIVHPSGYLPSDPSRSRTPQASWHRPEACPWGR